MFTLDELRMIAAVIARDCLNNQCAEEVEEQTLLLNKIAIEMSVILKGQLYVDADYGSVPCP